MRYFLQSHAAIRVINEPAEFACTVTQFQLLEPDYPALPTGKTIRYWTPENAYLDGDARAPIDHDCGPYTLKCAQYADPGPFVYAHVSLSKGTLCIDADPPDSIEYAVHLKASMDPNDPDVPLDYAWIMRVRNESDLFVDAFHIAFVQGYAHGVYVYQAGLPLGRYYLKEEDFDKVFVGGVSYTVKLLAPLMFTLYRET